MKGASRQLSSLPGSFKSLLATHVCATLTSQWLPLDPVNNHRRVGKRIGACVTLCLRGLTFACHAPPICNTVLVATHTHTHETGLGVGPV